MALCPSCGAHNADDSTFCTTCGHGLTADAGTPAAAATAEVRYGGFWRRLPAFLIDWAIIWIPLGIIVKADHLYWIQHVTNGHTRSRYYDLTPGGELIGFLLGAAYFIPQESSSRQATLGKRVMRLKVTDYSGERISVGRATGRYFAKILSGFVLFIGYIMAAFTPRKRALHDLIASTLVRRT